VFDGCSNVSITGPIYNKTQLGSTTNGDLTITGKFNALSDRYDRTEYIEATGRQYINTGYSFKSENIRIELAVEFKDFPNDMSLFGSNSSSPERSDLIPYTWYEYGNNIAVFRHWIGTSGDLMDVEYDTEGLNTIVYTVKNNTLTCLINGETYSADFEGSIITGRSLYIFGKNNAGSSAEKGSGYRLYYFRIYDDGELVRDFVPCSDTYSSTDYQPGLYDLVTDVFYTNSGQNEFNLKFASNLKATDYIQSNGSQYINTGYVVSSNKLRIEFAAEFPSTPNDISLFGSNSSNYDLVPYTWQSYGTRVFKHWVGTSDGILSVPYSTGVNTVVYTLQSGTLTCSINGNSYSSSFSGSIITGQNFYIFGKNDAGSSAEKGNGYKLYYFRIYDNDVLVRDFVPCYYRSNSSTVGLYDTVTRTFYSRSGSGSLSKGSTSFERIPDPDERFKACTVLTSLKLDCSGVIPNYAFSDCTNLEEVRIGLSLTKIGEYAFSGCTNLTSVTFAGGAGFSNLVGANHNASSASGNLTYTGGSSLTSIGSYAFKNCTSLTEVEIPESVTTFSDYMFSGCTNLHHLIAPIYSASNSYFSGLTNLHLTINGNGTSIGSSAFYNCSGLTSVTIPSSVTSIGNYAFQYCSGLTSITIPNSVTSIGSQAFYYCDSLTSITIPSSVTSIGSYAFGYCSGLTNVTISYGVTSTGNYTFYNCSGLTSITIPNSVTSIGNYTFRGCTGLTSITIPSSVRSIGQDAFNNCSSLTSITIPSSVTSIGSEAFYGCTGLTSITIPSSVTSIPNYAFNNCTGLTSITIPNSVTSIGQYAFNNCTGLTSITIPSSVTSIGQYAFQNCTGLTSITIPSSVTSIRDYTFYNCTGLTSITIPSSVTSIARYAFSGCTGLTSATFEITSGWSHNGYTANGLNFWSGSFSSETLSDTSYAAKILIGLKGAMTRS